MKLFTKKPPEAYHETAAQMELAARIAREPGLRAEEKVVFDRYPVGSGFAYLGAELRVTRHLSYYSGFVGGPYNMEIYAKHDSALMCEFRGADGLFHTKAFEGQHFTAIAKGFQP
jgi:hypothetical protein